MKNIFYMRMRYICIIEKFLFYLENFILSKLEGKVFCKMWGIIITIDLLFSFFNDIFTFKFSEYLFSSSMISLFINSFMNTFICIFILMVLELCLVSLKFIILNRGIYIKIIKFFKR